MFSKFADKIGLYDFLAPTKRRRSSRSTTASDDDSATTAKSSSDENRLRRSRLDAQLKAENDAAARGPKFFAKKQRVRYLNKATNSVCDAIVIGAHLDDPDDPYYTIKYKKQCEEIADDGSKEVIIREVEKQTNPDRLSRVPWDEDKSWKVLQ